MKIDVAKSSEAVEVDEAELERQAMAADPGAMEKSTVERAASEPYGLGSVLLGVGGAFLLGILALIWLSDGGRFR